MKVKTKYISTIIVFCLIVFLTSCENEDFKEEPKSSQNEIDIQLKKINFNELRANPNAIQKLKEVSLKNASINGRSFYHEDYSVFIDTTNIIMIEQNGNHSITFRIINENSENEIQNLILKSNNNGIHNAYIVTYLLSQEELNKILNGEALTNKAPSSINDLNQYARGGAIGDGADCVDFWTYTELYCRNSLGNTIRDNGELGNGCVGTSFEIEHQVLKIDMDCMSSGGGVVGPGNPGDPGTNPGNPVNPNTGTGGGGSPNPPILTTPLLEVNRNKLPCDQLKNLKGKTGFTSKMTTLKNNIGGTKEMGFMLIDNPSNEFSYIIEGNNQGNIEYPYQFLPEGDLVKFYGTAHNHLENKPDQIGVFTPEDFDSLSLNGIIETHPDNPYKKTKPEKAIALVITKTGLFAMKINDLEKLNTFVAKYKSIVANGPEKADEYLNRYFQNPKEYNILPTSTHDEQVTGFLRFMKDEDLGIDLYEGNKSDFGGWKKLSLIDNGNGTFSHSAVPCN